jgi:predicted HTH transcriptional regulator
MLAFVEEPPAALAAPEEQLGDLIARGENDRCEFKSTMRHCVKTSQSNIPEAQRKEVIRAKDKDRNHDVLKSVAAMLNTSGGDVIVGIDDHGNPLGLAVRGSIAVGSRPSQSVT